MKHRFALQCLASFILLLLATVYIGRLVRLAGDVDIDLGGRQATTLTSDTADFLDRINHRISFTFFVSPRHRMPSHFQGVEEYVRRLLLALKEENPAHIDYRVLYPENSTAGIAYASRHKVSSFSVRRVVQDEHGEEKIWSSLVIAGIGSQEVLIQGIENAHLPFLEELVVEHLRSKTRPLRPTLAVAAPAYFQLLTSFLGEYGDVIEIDLNSGAPIPSQADLLFWMQPTVVTPEHVRQLRRYVDAGRTVVLAGSAYGVGYAPHVVARSFQAQLMPRGWHDLTRALGLRAVPDLLMDKNSGVVSVVDTAGNMREVEAPFHLRCLPAFYRLKNFSSPAKGGLSFVAASALEVDLARVAQIGFRAEVIGTTTANAWIRSLPTEPFGMDALDPGFSVPKQNLMVLLKSDDPWKGRILALASSSLFQDGIINQAGYAHRVFLRTLVRTFTASDLLVRNRVVRPTPATVPTMGGAARLWWRFAVAFLIPVVLVVMGLRRYFRVNGLFLTGLVGRSSVLYGALMLAILIIGVQWWSDGSRFFIDFTSDGSNTSAVLTRAVLAQQRDISVTVYSSPRAAMPAALKTVGSRVKQLLAGQIGLEIVNPDQLQPVERRRLVNSNIIPFEVQRVMADTMASPLVWSALQLTHDGRTASVPRLDGRSVRHLEFLVIAAVQRLAAGRAPHIAVISDLPRLSPAEALEDFQKKGLIAPTGVDVYSQTKDLLRTYGYHVSHVNPKDPQMPEGVDVVLWFQPRRNSEPIQSLVSRHLVGGGKAIVAMQHFNIQQRQYRGSGFRTVYWPQPQFQDFDPYLESFGVRQVREVLFDRTRSHLDLETQVNRSAVREYDPQKVALPFLIRAVGANFSDSSVITRRLGDLLFIWGNHFVFDTEGLAKGGIDVEVLVSTSERAWTFPWKGGWLPADVFSTDSYLAEPQPLAVLLNGVFRNDDSLDGDMPASGELMLIGCSEMFKNDYLYASAFHHDQFLLNSVAYMAYGADIAALQSRRPPPRGFAFQSATTKRLWRVAVVGAGPLVITLYGLGRRRRLAKLK